jgi:hypothetical protein
LGARTQFAIYSMRQYYILNQDSRALAVFKFIKHHKLTVEVHANRTRFSVPEGPLLTNFLLRFADSCSMVDPTLDLATGLPLAPSD